MKKLINGFFCLYVFFLSFPVLAVHGGLGGMANQVVQGPLAILWNFMDDACYVAALILFLIGFSKYMHHRRSPQEIPISTPIFYVILAIVMALLPFAYYFTNVNFG
jgi:hypothetical protein